MRTPTCVSLRAYTCAHKAFAANQHSDAHLPQKEQVWSLPIGLSVPEETIGSCLAAPQLMYSSTDAWGGWVHRSLPVNRCQDYVLMYLHAVDAVILTWTSIWPRNRRTAHAACSGTRAGVARRAAAGARRARPRPARTLHA